MKNVRTKKPSESDVTKSAPALSGPAGNGPNDRLYLCMGPHCWGRGTTAAEAVRNAKKNRIEIYEGKNGWCWILFDIRPDVTVDEMGSLCWTFREGEGHDSPKPYKELLRYNVPAGSIE